MVETPIEMLGLDRWCTEADFVAVGCNDLLAHLCGAARDDPRLTDLLDPYRPELFRFLAESAGRAGSSLERLRLCGVLPQVEGVLPILIGLGFREFSGETRLIPLLARQVSRTTLGACRDLARTVCAAPGSRAVRELVGAPPEGPWGLVTDRGNEPARNA
jgi:phosphoenolpyruvate-protein kinase (PTS system EI component)